MTAQPDIRSSGRAYILLLGILLITAISRLGSIVSSHDSYDELFYVGLALKLREAGIRGYNLRNLDVQNDTTGTVTGIIFNPSRERGTLLQQVERGGVYYVSRETLANWPPLFSGLILASAAVFAPDAQVPPARLLVLHRRPSSAATVDAWRTGSAIQFYATGVNITLAVLLVLLTFALGRELYDERCGMIAAALMAAHPVDLLTSQRVWADELTAVLVTLSVLFALRGIRHQTLLPFAAAGVCAGLSILAKGSGLFVLGGIVAALGLGFLMADRAGRKYSFRAVLIFLAAAIPIAALWHGLVYSHYGTPFYLPKQEGIAESSSWFAMLASRNRFGQWVYFAALSPVLLLFYAEIARVWRWQYRMLPHITAAVLVLSFLGCLTLISAKEERYVLPVYPVICVFSAAFVLSAIRLIRRVSPWPKIAASILIAIAAIPTTYTAWIALNFVWGGGHIFPLF